MTEQNKALPGREPVSNDYKQVREERRLLKAQLEVVRLRAEKRVTEGLTVYGDGVGALLGLYDRYQDLDGSFMPIIGSINDKQRGQNFPFFRTEMELNLLRQPSRILYGTNMYARGIVNGLQSYIVGDGLTYQAEPMEEGSSNDGEIAAVQRIIDDLCEENMMCELEEEAIMRGERDGEGFVRVFWPDGYDTAQLRTIEPEQIAQAPSQSDKEWKFGIRNPMDEQGNVDAQVALEYDVRSMEPDGTWEFVDAREVMHFKRNVERSVKRGMPTFVFGTFESIDSAGRLKRNMVEGSAYQAAIAEIVEYEIATNSQITAMTAQQTANYGYTRNTGPLGNGQPINYMKTLPATRRHIPKGMKYVSPPGAENVPGHVEALQAALRAAGIVWNAPEWLSSGLHDTSSFASSLTAESPFVKGIKRMQGFYCRRFVNLLKLVLSMAEDMGRLKPGVLKRVKITAKGPAIEVRDKLKEAQASQVFNTLGAESPQQICQEQGRDYEETSQQIEEHTERFGPPGGQMGMPGDEMPGSGQQRNPNAPRSEPKPVRESMDAEGHEHKGSGPGGGQFTGHGGGGTAEKKAKGRVPEQEPNEKAARAKAAHVMVDKPIQRYAEEYNEPRMAKILGGISHPDSEPMDITTKNGDLVEMKTLVMNGNDKITMDSYSQIRKIVKEKETGKTFHTIISDDSKVYNPNGEHDESQGRTYYYRRGVAGSARIGSMYKCKNEAELKSLMAMPEGDLPEAAQRTDSKHRVGKWVAVTEGGRKGFRNKKTGETFWAKK